VKRGRILRVAPVLLLLLGTGLLGQGAWIHAKAWLAYRLLDVAWVRQQAGEDQVRPWSWADTWPVAKISVKRLRLERLVLAGASGRTLAFGPGHVSGTALPGVSGNSVISGHRDTHFRFLKDLRTGDHLQVEMPAGRQVHYQVESLSRHHESEVSLLGQTGADQLTLITCYPFDSLNPGTSERYVVKARMIDIRDGSRKI